MKDFILMTAKSLVDRHIEVDWQEVIGQKTTVFELRVAKKDLGKVIGKHEKTARPMRAILKATATRLEKRAVLENVE